MLVVLSPAKTLDLEPTDVELHSQPRLLDDAEKLVTKMREFTTGDIRALMNVSESIAEENVARYSGWAQPFTTDNAKQAMLTFKGDTYRDLQLDAWSDEDRAWAHDHVRILSGLYGVLRPMDLMQAYRLEMGTKLSTSRGKSLYEFWGNRITDVLKEDLASGSHDFVLNLASNEYWKSVNAKALDVPIVKVDFKDRNKNGDYKVISFFAKRARGMMTDWVIRNRVETVDELRNFDVANYEFNADQSKERHLVFLRDDKPD